MKNNSFDNIKKYLYKDVKEFNSYILSFVCIGIIMVAGLISYFMTNSFAWFTQVLESDKNINVVVDVPTSATLVSGEDFFDTLSTYRNNIVSAQFLNGSDPNVTGATYSFDVSEDNDGSVMAYLVPNSTDSTKYDLKVKTTRDVLYANSDSGGMFSNHTDIDNGFSSLSVVDVSKLDVSMVIDMSIMFTGTPISSFDASTWNTSNVLNMVGMFSGCSLLAEVVVDSWDTSSVTDMNSMFYGCSLLTELNANSWSSANIEYSSGYMCMIADSGLEETGIKFGPNWNISYSDYSFCLN